jgi:hypothetical protein
MGEAEADRNLKTAATFFSGQIPYSAVVLEVTCQLLFIGLVHINEGAAMSLQLLLIFSSPSFFFFFLASLFWICSHLLYAC